jgi:hypothetical protein
MAILDLEVKCSTKGNVQTFGLYCEPCSSGEQTVEGMALA